MKASEILNNEQLAQVRERRPLLAIWLVLHAWALIFAAMALFAWWPNVITFLIAAFVIGGRQLGLSVLMHDGAHGLLLSHPRWNERLGQWFCGWPVGADLFAYRRYHLAHHAHTQQENDPDLVLSKPFPVTRKSLRRKVIRDLTGQTGFNQRLAQIQAGIGKPQWTLAKRLQHAVGSLGGFALSNAILLGLLSLAGYWWLYPLLWLLPLLTTYQFVLRIRNIAEHAMIADKDDPFANARTTRANWLARLILAPYWVNYHVEHHLLMWVPCYNLPRLHQFLLAGPYAERLELAGGYGQVLTRVTSLPDDQDKSGTRVQNERRRFSGLVMEEE